MAPRLIPREGIFTPDFGLSLLQSTVLNPVLTGSLLAAVRNLPRETLARWSQTLRVDLLSPRTLKTLKYLLIIGAARQANKVLSSLVLNNWERTTWDWKNEVALVTGGSGGIGYHVAVGLANHGLTVAIVDVQEPRFPLPPNAHFYKGDVTTTSGINSFASAIRSAHGNPTILFNNAGIGGGGTIIAEPEATIRRVFEVNTLSHFLTVKEFVPAMIAANHGHIVTTASMASFTSIGGMVDYACTKASALAFHEGLAQELKSYHDAPKVRTTVVHPSWTCTPLVQPLLDASSKVPPTHDGGGDGGGRDRRADPQREERAADPPAERDAADAAEELPELAAGDWEEWGDAHVEGGGSAGVNNARGEVRGEGAL